MHSSDPVRKYDFRRAKAALVHQPLAVVERLGCKVLPAKMLDFWFIQPRRFPEASSLWVAKRDGSWRHEGKNVGGDIIDLIAYCRQCSKLEALDWAYQFLGWTPGTADAARGLSDAELLRLDAQEREKQARAEADRLARGYKLATMWAGLPTAEGTVADIYLRETRNIPLHLLSRFPGSLRFEQRAEHQDLETGEVTEWPAMVALMAKDGRRGGQAIHRTYLLPDGSGKAPVEPQKQYFGVKKGTSIRLTRGAGDLTPREAIARGVKVPLIIGEGIETTLSVACFLSECRAWAGGDLGNMATLAWPAYVSDVILLRDNDQHPMAVKAFDKVEAWWRDQAKATGGRVIVERSDRGSDFNDELR